MKKMIATLLAAMMLLSLLSGCGIGRKAPDATTEAPIETAAAAETTEAATEATTVPVSSNSSFKAGTWMSEYESTGWYYFFDEGGASGYFVSMDDGAGESFTYVQNGDEAIMYLGDSDEGDACEVVFLNDENVMLSWDDQTIESFTYVSELGMDEFHFYTHDELAQMALEDYKMKNDSSDDSLEAAGMDNGDGTATIQIYQNLGDHNSTAAYYTVDRCSGEGKNVSDGTDVDLTKGTQDIDIFYGDSETKLPSDTPLFVLSELMYTEPIVLQFLSPVSQFQLVTLEYVEDGEDYAFRVEEIVYEAASMGIENALVFLTEVVESVPDVGVIYKDRNGEKHLYAVLFSGVDGSALLVEQPLV